jgi:aryl-alcohol dehydrogenase-like predicted oxidoreductase
VILTARTELCPGYSISRIIRGGWQLAGGHGPIDRREAIAGLLASFKAGISTFDGADIYTGVEGLLGELRQAIVNHGGTAALSELKIHTKFVPDLDTLSRLSKIDVCNSIERSLRRLRMERLDLVQFHWWDYSIGDYVQAAMWLKDLQQEGKISLIGGTNFDVPRTAALLQAGLPVAAMQVQYSLLDDRPTHGLIELCRTNGVHLLCYGTVAGGFLNDAWLGRKEPDSPLETRSQVKYKLIIDEFGGWGLFQELLRILRRIADRHGVDIATVASSAILDQPQVAAIIVGARNPNHLAANLDIAELRLSVTDRAEIDQILSERLGPEGDVFALERERVGRHGSIMKYNLNRESS